MNYIPTNTTEIYEQLKKRSGLCAGLALKENMLVWQLTGCTVSCFLEGERALVSIQFGPGRRRTVQRRPEPEDMLGQLLDLGRVGHVIVLRAGFLTGREELLYAGPRETCPYPLRKKWDWGRLYIYPQDNLAADEPEYRRDMR